MKDIQNTISGFRNDAAFASLYENAIELTNQPSRTRGNSESTRETVFRHLFFEIVDHILVQLSDRFQSMLDFVEPLDPSKVSIYRHKFPKSVFSSLLKNYGRHFDRFKLEAKLRAFYYAKEFENLFADQILELLRTTELFTTTPQIVKLCELVLAVPATSASVERSFSALKRIKNCCRNSMGQTKLRAKLGCQNYLCSLLKKTFLLTLK